MKPKFRTIDYQRVVDYLEGTLDLKDVAFIAGVPKGGNTYAYLLRVIREMYRSNLVRFESSYDLPRV